MDKSKSFVKNNFFPNSIPSDLFLNDCLPMTQADIKWLVDEGHCIGAHTVNHPILSTLDYTNQYKEIVEGADTLAELINKEVNYFAYPFGSLNTMDKNSYEIVKKRFKYAFSNIRGMVEESPSNHFIFRQNLVPQTPLWLVKSILEGKIDFVYTKTRKKAKVKFT